MITAIGMRRVRPRCRAATGPLYRFGRFNGELVLVGSGGKSGEPTWEKRERGVGVPLLFTEENGWSVSSLCRDVEIAGYTYS